MSDVQRKSWTEKENKMLIGYWDVVGSITLLSLILKRSPSSIQTQASRLSLPRRTENLQRHRRRWSEEEERMLDAAMLTETDDKGLVRIDIIAQKLDRSVDAVVAKLATKFENPDDLIAKIYIPEAKLKDITTPVTTKKSAKKPEPKLDPRTGRKAIEDTRHMAKQRNCLVCSKPFWSQGAHHRVCGRCKKTHEEDGWYGGW